MEVSYLFIFLLINIWVPFQV